MFVFLKINADFKLSTRWLPLVVVDLCIANSLGTVHMVFPAHCTKNWIYTNLLGANMMQKTAN